MRARVAFEPTCTIVHLVGELDLAVKDELRDLFQPLTGLVIVDLSRVAFVDSTAMGVIVFAGRHLGEGGGELWLRSPPDATRRVIRIMGFEDWIET
jgi:anti-sigma B factor antagonist